MPAPTIAVIRLAVHPTKVDLCSGSTTACSVLMAVLRDVMLNGELRSSCSLPLLFDAMPDETRRGARKGDLGGSTCLLDGEGVIVLAMLFLLVVQTDGEDERKGVTSA